MEMKDFPDTLAPVLGAVARSIWPRSIGRRLALGFGALVALMLLALWYASVPVGLVSEATQRFANGDMQRLLRVQALSLQTEGVGSALVRLMNAPRKNRELEYTDVDERNRRIDGIIDSLRTDLRDPEQETTLQRLIQSRATYHAAYLTTVDQIEADNLKAATKALNEQINPALKALRQESNALLQRERERIESELAEAQSSFHRIAMYAAMLSIAVVTLAAWLAWLTTRSVVRPLGTLETGARSLARGNYDNRVEITGTKEIDRVGRALNTMAEAVAQREQQIVRLAYQDPLTGLPNRTALLTPELPPLQPPNCVAILDLARLKGINETLGYTTGDTLIKELALRASEVFDTGAANGQIGAQPVVARLSGGTFAVAFHMDSRGDVEVLRERMERAMAEPVLCSGHSVDLNVAYGFADVAGDTNPGVQTLMRNAEVALHSAKRGAIGYAWYSEAQEAARLSHLGLISELRGAVAASQLQMWLQPKFALANGRAIGAEALVRWQHPQRGFISPAEFIPFAEQTGYITMVTDWMLREALGTLQTWQSSHPDLSIAVNVSTRDLQDAGFAKRVERLLGARSVDPAKLRLEITESGLMDDAQKSVELLSTLRQIGVQLSIDDFGTGYSSLAYLQKLPVSELKIDRSFIDRIDTAPGTQKLVRAMTEMGHGLDLMVTAEGVETEAEREVIKGLGCDVLQGYLGSRPLHGDALKNWLSGL
jgi:diguanylate cyclase (GGDEF)-like protein